MVRTAFALALAVALLPAAAHAGTLSTTGTTVTYRAAPGEANRVEVTARTGRVVVVDRGAPVSGCTAVSTGQARCDGRFARVRLVLGDRADTARSRGIASVVSGGSGPDALTGGSARDELTGGSGNDLLRGGAGNDTLYGEAGHDRLLGGSGRDFLDGDFGDDTLVGGSGRDTMMGFVGRDFLDSVDGVRETVECGTERDRARVDRGDRIQFCERVTRVR